MKTYALALLALVALTAFGIFLVARQSIHTGTTPVIITSSPTFSLPPVPRVPPADPAREEEARKAADAAKVASAHVIASAPGDAPRIARKIDAAQVSSDGSNDPFAAEKEAIHGFAVSNNPANVPAIARYLEHENAELRQEAVLGLLTLGEKAGAPFLIAATVKARTPEEAETLRDAAEFLNKGIKNSTRPAPTLESGIEPPPSDPAR